MNTCKPDHRPKWTTTKTLAYLNAATVAVLFLASCDPTQTTSDPWVVVGGTYSRPDDIHYTVCAPRSEANVPYWQRVHEKQVRVTAEQEYYFDAHQGLPCPNGASQETN